MPQRGPPAFIVHLRRSPRPLRFVAAGLFAALVVLAVLVRPPILQRAAHYSFADERSFLGIPHAAS